jgi:CRP-like cAMP-binding protein
MSAKELLYQHVSKVVQLRSDEFEYFFSHFQTKSFTKGQVVVSIGDLADAEYFVVSGCLKTFYISDDTKMYILQFAMPTWWASDYNALYSEVKATVGVDCIVDSEVLCLKSSDREKLCREIHAVEHFFRWRTNRGYVASQNRLLSVMNNDVRHRYEELMRMYPQLYDLVPKSLIAAYLGVSRETLSRLYNDREVM